LARFRQVLAELKRRHVYRVAVAYAVVAWVVVQAASIVVPELMLPAWITRALIVVAILGFPLALVLAWAFDITPAGVQRTLPSGEAEAGEKGAARDATRGGQGAARGAAPDVAVVSTSARRRALAGVAVLAVVAVVGAGIARYALVGGSRGDVPAGAVLLDSLAVLSDSARYLEAFDMAQVALARGDALPDSLLVRFTDRLSVLTDPPGAAVRGRRFADRERGTDGRGTGGWIELGTTPLRGVSLPRDDYHLRIEAAGHAAVERIASSGWSRSTFNDVTGSEVQLEVRLLPTDRQPPDMVHVPGGRYQVASRDLQSLSAELEDFHIDRFEVSNARFAEFVDAGGYARSEYWSDLADAIAGEAGGMLAQFVDRTGLPGPRAWTGQQHPPSLADHPVTHVSWYEAAAYCRFRQARLPTLFEWEKTARDGVVAVRAGVMLPWGYVASSAAMEDRANFNGTGTTPVGSFPFGISTYGAYDMAGNVKEWLHNQSEAGRAVTGGSWADPMYVFQEVGSLEPSASSPTVGFRCARPAAAGRPESGAQGDGPIRLVVTTPQYRPVDEETFRTLLSHYHYDRQPLDATIEERVETPAWIRERIRYNGPAGSRTLAYLFVPKTGRPPYQIMVYVPGSDALWGNNVATIAEEAVGPLVRSGRALFAVVMEGMTEREYPADFAVPASNSVAFRDQMVRRATELRTGLDYLETRADIDAGALAYVGSSWGAGSRLVFAAVDDRFRAVVLIGAGIDERVHPTLPEASNINFAPYIRAPTLVVNGREDEEHPWRTRGLALWNLLTEPKELALFDGVGHLPPAELRIPRIREFLDRTLGAVGQ
jgi:eukaryotic-like serine/threonine-protein kinase